MNFLRSILVPLTGVVALALPLSARDALSEDDLKLLHDGGGWQYISVSDTDNGIQTTHTCFDGQPHPQQCSGTLTLTASNTFVQNVTVHGQSTARHGNYELSGTQLSFFDELGTRDGPYTVTLDAKAKSMVLQLTPVRIELQLDKEYRSKGDKAK